MRKIWFPAVILVALAATGCSLTTPADNIIENLSGTVAPGGNSDKTFTVANRGEVTLKITSVTPSVNGSLYVGLGQPNGTICGIFTNTIGPVTVNREIPYGLLDQATYCVTLFDPGVLTVPTTFTGTLSHP